METVLRVIHKPSGETRYINTERFNPGIHERIDGESPVLRSHFKALRSAPQERIIIPNKITPELTKKTAPRRQAPAPKPEANGNDEVPANLFKARKWAAEKGMAVSPKTTKQEIKDWISKQ